MSMYKTFTVYLGSSGRCRPIFKETAYNLGAYIGKQNKTLVYGGMDAGLMGIVANASLKHGARVTGIIPKKLKDSERIHPDLSQTILVPDLWERKFKMFKRADVIITLPGGFGTIDEFLEALYWGQLGAHTKPLILLNTENYWDEFISFLNTLDDFNPNSTIIVNNIHEIEDALCAWQAYQPEKTTSDFPHFENEILSKETSPLIFESLSIGESYKFATALGLKQLGKHNRPIGIIENQQSKPLLNWIETSQKEHFITDRCTQLFSVAKTKKELSDKLNDQCEIKIDLHNEKWGPSETKTHIELKEKE